MDKAIVKRSAAYNMLDARRDSLVSVMPGIIADRDQFCLLALEVADSYDLAGCTPLSVVRSIYGAAKLGLSLDKSLGQAFIIPRKFTATLQIGYLGWLELAHRSKRIAAVHAEVVYENDEYDELLGSDRKIIHKRWDIAGAESPGELRFAYCTWFDCLSQTPEFHRVPRERIERARKSAGTSVVWNADPVAMWKKTALTDAHRFWKLTPELAFAGRLEDSVERGEPQELPTVPGMNGDEPAAKVSILNEYDNQPSTPANGVRVMDGDPSAQSALNSERTNGGAPVVSDPHSPPAVLVSPTGAASDISRPSPASEPQGKQKPLDASDATVPQETPIPALPGPGAAAGANVSEAEAEKIRMNDLKQLLGDVGQQFPLTAIISAAKESGNSPPDSVALMSFVSEFTRDQGLQKMEKLGFGLRLQVYTAAVEGRINWDSKRIEGLKP